LRILITSSSTEMGKILAKGLSFDNEVVQAELSTVLGPLTPTPDLIKNIDAIVHLLDTDIKVDVSESLDSAMRGTYDLLWSAAQEGISRIVLLSTLSLFSKYDEVMRVTETWRPTVTTDPKILCNHLAEYVCREFAREGRLSIVCLRLGELVLDPSQQNIDSGVYPEDAVYAVKRALKFDLPLGKTTELPQRWSIFHVQSETQNARFPIENARSTLGFEPTQRYQK